MNVLNIHYKKEWLEMLKVLGKIEQAIEERESES